MKNSIKILVALFMVTLVQAQKTSPFFKEYDWSAKPNYKVKENTTKDMVAIKEKMVTEFCFEGDNFIEYFLEHKILWLNSDERIEDFNKVYLPYAAASDLIINKARVITKEGKIVDLDESKILEASNEETGRKYKYFAFEGVEKGSFIEYMYVVRKNPSYKGKRLSLQASYDKKEVSFDLYAPENLVFKFKTYNTKAEVKEDTLTKQKNHWKLNIKELKKLEKENQSAYNAVKGFLVYKLDKNTAYGATGISSYSNVAKNIYKIYYPESYKKKTKQLLTKFLNEVNIDENIALKEKIRKLESFIKRNIYLSNISDRDLETLDKILSKKVMNEFGAMKLYVALLRVLKIKHEIVLTSDRRELKFDKAFEASNFLTDFLIYIPKAKMYLAPNKMQSRFGFPPEFLMDNYGLFIKEVKLGKFKSAVGKIKYIKPVKAKETYDTMLIDVSFNNENITENKIKLDRSFNGYYASSMQPFMHLIKGKDKEELVESMVKNINDEIEITNKKVLNDKPEDFGKKPLQFVIDFTSEAFVEKAGRKYLFKLGELIGPQTQLYQEKERKLPLEERYQRSYYRTINVNIPEGYSITNLNDINIDNSYSEDGKELFSFTSSYVLEGNVLKITADEHYRKNIIPVSLYEAYRKVINSAADFNKITLVLEKVK